MTTSEPMRWLQRSCWALAFAAFNAAAQTTPVDVVADFPPGPGPFPAVVLAPGQGYHMALPAMQRPAAELVKRGVAVYRFNWAYWSREPRGAPSNDLAAELHDLRGVIAIARSDSRVDARQIAVGGKSLGSLVAWQAFRSDPALAAVVLLTPVCNQPAAGARAASPIAANYRGIERESRPMLFVLGDHDPACEPKALYRYAATAKGPVRISVVGGDHGFASPARDGSVGEAATRRNVADVADSVASFVKQLAGFDTAVAAAEAKAPPPGFMVIEYEVTDLAGYRDYVKASDAARAAGGTGGTFLVRGAQGVGLSGEPPRTLTIVQFASVAEAVAFDLSPAYVALKTNRDKSTTWRSFVVEGVPRPASP